MNKKFIKFTLLTLSFFLCTAFAGVQNISACDNECKCLKTCLLYKILNDDTIVETSKEKLLEAKKKLEEAISNLDVSGIGQQAVESLQECLSDLNKKIDSFSNKNK